MWRALQLTLDLLVPPREAVSAPASSPVPATVPTPVPAPPSHAAPAQDAPAVALADSIAPARFDHPRANRRAQLAGAVVAYELRRSRRRTIGFAVDGEGLVVSAPRWVPLYEIESALQEKATWIARKLSEMREREQRLESSRIAWADGCTLPWLGRSLRVQLDPTATAMAQLSEPIAPGMPDAPATLRIRLPLHSEPAQIRDAVQAWLMREARRVFTERLDHFAPQLGVRWQRLGLSSAGTRWGSAGADGSIRLNWRLIHLALPAIDYVVVHELSHLRVLDHSPRFWDTVAQVLPDYAERRALLRDEAVPRWD